MATRLLAFPVAGAGAVAAAAALIVTGATPQTSAEADAGTRASAAPGDVVSIARLADDPAGMSGRRVTVTGVVDETYRGGAFAIGDEDGREVVVLPEDRGGKRPVTQGTVQVTGQARRVGVDLRRFLRNDFDVRARGAAVDAVRVRVLPAPR